MPSEQALQFGLKPETIAKINLVFNKYSNIKKVIIYGSRAKGNFKNGSDIDLTMIGENISLTQQLKIENELDDLLLPYKIDLSIFEKIDNHALLEHINKIGLEFYCCGIS